MEKEYIITPDLSDLQSSPGYRGYVERVTEDALLGWCLATDGSVVRVQIQVNGIIIGAVDTDMLREDVAGIIGRPVSPGFRFAFKAADREALARALSQRPDVDPELSVLVSGHPMAMAPGLRLSRVLLSALPAPTREVASQRVDNLTAGPRYRGCLDTFADNQLTGWCLDVQNPMAAVDLAIYVESHLVGTFQTAVLRPDVSKLAGFPVRAGFNFRLKELESASLARVAKLLTQALKAEEIPETLISVSVAGTDVELPKGAEFFLTRAKLKELLDLVGWQYRTLSQNIAVRLRDKLLEPVEFTVDTLQDDVGLIAFYLPQFHSFAENNEWWGEGFTEWTNVSSARPSFPGHDQPRLPADFGYYDLRLDEVQRQQVALANVYGIRAFCYHYYWFSGTTLMTMPIDRHVEQNYDLDFCLCWANENWSRRWDGSEDDVLMAQHHSILDDVAFIDSALPYFRSPRYLKINGAPLLVVYRLTLLSDPAKVIDLWKQRVRDAGFPDLHVCMAETFGVEDPLPLGADSSCQFPPHCVVAQDRTAIVEGLAPGFTGKVYDYAEMVANEVRRPDPGHLRFRTVSPSWDNTARKGLAGHVFHGATPELFEAWLTHSVARTRETHPIGHRFVFINAWNEWAEGAYLEPDRRNGHANLRAVRNALSIQNAVIGEALLSTASPQEAEFRQKVIRVVMALSNANKQLSRLITEYARPGGPPSPFIPLRADAFERRLSIAGGRIQIDSVNGRGVRSPQLTLLREAHMDLQGWFHVPDLVQTPTLPTFIILDGMDKRPSYIASVYDRVQRQDVAAAFGITGEQQWFGFHLHADLRRLEPGHYRIGALLVSDAKPDCVYALSSSAIIYVG